MDEYALLLKKIAINNEQDDICRLINIFLDYTDDFIIGFKGRGVPDEDLKQECALVISEYFYDCVFMEKNGRRELFLTGSDEIIGDVIKEIIHEVSEGCEKALAVITETEERSKKAGSEVLAKVNLINEGTERFISEYGIKPTPAELSDFLDIDEEVIIEAVELSGYEIKNIDFDTPVRNHKT